MTYTFDITPVGKPRMTQSDQWKTNPNHPDPRKAQRPAVTQWFAFQRILQALAYNARYKITDRIDVVFFLPMPDSWSKKKKREMLGKPHQSKPDADNLMKAFKDSLAINDEQIWDERSRKFWGDKGSIMVIPVDSSEQLL